MALRIHLSDWRGILSGHPEKDGTRTTEAALESRGVNYAIRIPANENLERDIARLLHPGGKAQYQALGRVQELSLQKRHK